jgi:hypothetical protein
MQHDVSVRRNNCKGLIQIIKLKWQLQIRLQITHMGISQPTQHYLTFRTDQLSCVSGESYRYFTVTKSDVC